jgi:tyramine---L-glutamate ligase
MKVFVYEFVTGGALAGEELSPNLVNEANLFTQALLHDLTAVPGVEVTTTRDARLPALPAELAGKVQLLTPNDSENSIDVYLRGMQTADAVWPIAPEIGGMLEGLTQLAVEANKPLLGSRTRAVRAGASKLLTATVLGANGIATVPTFAEQQELPEIAGKWIVKPDDGAGCSRMLILEDVRATRAFLKTKIGWNLVAQPWLEGEPMSLSLLCADGQTRLLSINKQFVSTGAGAPSLDSIFVNAHGERDGKFTALAQRIAGVMTGLWGHVGVDLIVRADQVTVLEVNPRVTTSYAGLSRALGINAAQLVLDLHRSGQLPASVPNSGKPVILDW